MKQIMMAAGVLAVVVLVAAVFASIAPQPAAAQNTKCYMERGGLRWICQDGGTMLFQSGATLEMAAGSTLNANGFLTTTIDELTVNGNALITGTLETDGGATLASVIVEGNGDVTGNFEVTDHLLTQAELYMIPPDAITIVNGGQITITAAVMEITAAGEVTATLSTAGDGQLVTLINTGSNAINIVDTGTTYMAGNVALGQRDTISLIGVGTSWYEISRSNN